MGVTNGFQVLIECDCEVPLLVNYLKLIEKLMSRREWALTLNCQWSASQCEEWNAVAHKTSARSVSLVTTRAEMTRRVAKLAARYSVGWLATAAEVRQHDLTAFNTSPLPVYRLFPESVTSDLWSEASIAVIVTTHTPYLKYLEECLKSIDNQISPATERILVCDGCEAPEWVRKSGWLVFEGKWGTPNPARNLAVRNSSSEWVVFFDADNVMPVEYLAWIRAAVACAASNVGFIYPEIQYCDRKLKPTRWLETYEWNYWWARIQTCFDTSAAWRREALEMVGGFDENLACYDDYGLVLSLSRVGWQGSRLGFYMLMREHDSSIRRSTKSRYFNDGKKEDALWRARSLGITTVFAGRTRFLGQWEDFLQQAKLPPHVGLYVLDNSGNEEFGNLLRAACLRLSHRFTHMDLARNGRPFEIDSREGKLGALRHKHIGYLYNHVLPRITEDFVFILEDDVVPDPDALWRLSFVLKPDNNIAAVGAAYRSANSPEHVCAALSKEHWHNIPKFNELPNTVMEVGFVGAGCTLYNNYALKTVLPVMATKLKGHDTGWDGYLCSQLRKNGYRLWLHGGVRCTHNDLKP